MNGALNDPTWINASLSTYNGWIRNGRTGAKTLNLPLITMGGKTTDLLRRPLVNENVDNALLYGERYYPKASLRILLSDLAADITGLQGVTATAPVQLDGHDEREYAKRHGQPDCRQSRPWHPGGFQDASAYHSRRERCRHLHRQNRHNLHGLQRLHDGDSGWGGGGSDW